MRRFVIGAACLVAVSAAAFAAVRMQDAPGLPKPGKEHEFLKKFEGTWTTKETMTGPDGKAIVSEGSQVATLACGGLWLILDHKSSMMGQPFTGHGVMGYDLDKKKYTGVWVDNFIDYVMTYQDGKLEGNTLSWWCEAKDCSTGKWEKAKMSHEVKDADHTVLKMIMKGPDGKDCEGMSIEFTRKK